jgi:hypothetical protein
MNDNYLVLILCFSILIYFTYKNNTKENNTKENNTKENNTKENNTKDKFNNTIRVNDYIQSKINELNEQKEIYDMEIKNDNYIDNNNLLNNYVEFNKDINEYTDIIKDETNELKSLTNTNFKSVENNYNQYNNYKIDKWYFDFDKKYNNIFENNPNNSPIVNHHNDTFSNTNNNIELFSDTIENDNLFSSFLGTYFVLPYQYKNLNRVYFVISKYINEQDTNKIIEEGPNEIYDLNIDKYVMAVYIDDFMINEYEINIARFESIFLETYNSNTMNEANKNENPDMKDNLEGVTITIEKEIPLLIKNSTVINEIEIDNVKNILYNLGFYINNKFHLFLVKSKFEKKYLNITTVEGTKQKLEYQDTNDDLYRCYSINGTTLLHIKKKNEINKPFQSLINNPI